MDPFRKVARGEPLRIPAEAYNGFVDAALALRGGQQDRAVETGRAGRLRPDSIWVRNDSGAARDRFDILGIDSPLIDHATNAQEFENNVALSGVVPTTAGHKGKFVILLEPLPAGAIGEAVVAGETVCRVTGSGAYADVLNGDPAKLECSASGIVQILWAESGTATRWSLVRFGGASLPSAEIREVQMTETILPGQSNKSALRKDDGSDASMSIYDPSKKVCAVAGDRFTVSKNTTSAHWEPTQEFGLDREVIMVADVETVVALVPTSWCVVKMADDEETTFYVNDKAGFVLAFDGEHFRVHFDRQALNQPFGEFIGGWRTTHAFGLRRRVYHSGVNQMPNDTKAAYFLDDPTNSFTMECTNDDNACRLSTEIFYANYEKSMSKLNSDEGGLSRHGYVYTALGRRSNSTGFIGPDADIPIDCYDDKLCTGEQIDTNTEADFQYRGAGKWFVANAPCCNEHGS